MLMPNEAVTGHRKRAGMSHLTAGHNDEGLPRRLSLYGLTSVLECTNRLTRREVCAATHVFPGSRLFTVTQWPREL